MDFQHISERIKASFCGLTSFKVRPNTLEVITAFSTINNKFVSVFVTYTNNKIVVNDNGWVDQNVYETPLFDNCEDIVSRVASSYKISYNVKSTVDKSGIEFHYKTCESIDQIPSVVFDMANFVVGVVNAFCIQYRDEKEERDRSLFSKNANSFLKAAYADRVKLRQSLDDFKNIKFNAIVTRGDSLFLVTYVTGSTQGYFENDLRKSIVNFEIAMRSVFNSSIRERLTIFNDQSEGYQPLKSESIVQLLGEKTTREPISWTNKEAVLQYIS